MAICCQNCMITGQYKYRNELPNIKHSFLKRMEGRFHLQMAIPKEFKECFKGELAAWCILEGPSGNGWRIKVIQNQKNVFFSDGWVNFVKDHGLMLGDSCVFSYTGASTFKVMIFKQSGLEREEAFFTLNSSAFPSLMTCLSSLHTHRSNFCEDVPAEQELQDESKVSGLFEEKQNSDDFGDSFSLDFSGEGQITSKEKAPESTKEHDESYENEDEDKDEKPHKKRGRPSTSRGSKQRQTVYISRRREVTKEEIQAAYQFATAYVIDNYPEMPRIQITMLQSHVYQGFYMTIKKEWALEHMCLEDHDVKLQVQGEQGSWIIGCRWTSKHQCQLRAQWPAFVLDNNLEKYDVCVFEMVRKGNPRRKIKAVLNVHIFRVVYEVVPLEKVRKCA